MLAFLLLQAATLLPQPDLPPSPPNAEDGYLERFTLAAKEPVISFDLARSLRPTEPHQDATLNRIILSGNQAEVRLAAILATPCPPKHPLSLSLVKRACSSQNEATQLACLLALETAPPSSLPALAYLAQDAQQALSVRATATGLLLEFGLPRAWPLARSILLTGTASDSRSPSANWPRSGKYELPKRLLLQFVQRALAKSEGMPTAFEPNAAWDSQVLEVRKLDAHFKSIQSLSSKADPETEACFVKLLDLATTNEVSTRQQALRALAMLSPLTNRVLTAAAHSGDAARILAAQRAAAFTPR